MQRLPGPVLFSAEQRPDHHHRGAAGRDRVDVCGGTGGRGSLIGRDLLLGALSGASIGIALALNYQGLTVSSAALVSPIVGVGTASIPLLWAVAGGERPSGLVWFGAAVALSGIAITSISPHLKGRILAGVGLALASAFAFGVALTLVAETSDESGLWSGVSQRVFGFAVVAMLTRSRSQPLTLPGRLLPLALISGAVGSAGVLAFIAGTRVGDLSTITVAASLYPAVTALLAANFDGDTLRWWQMIGIGLALTGVGAMTIG